MKKTTHAVAAIAAAIALASCNSQKNEGGNAVDARPTVKVDPPKSGDWSEIVIATPAGGFQMGNPEAKVHLVEYGSMTCPHCAEFDEKGIPALIENYVKTGKVAFEFRNFVRDPLDLTGSLITRCNGAQSFFPLTRAMYADQKNWFTKIQAIPQAEMEKVQSMTPAQQFAAMAQYAGFQSWAAQRGVPSAKSSQCLANQSEADKLVEMNSDGASTFNIPGTPAFVINGKLVKDAATWPMLEPELKKAL